MIWAVKHILSYFTQIECRDLGSANATNKQTDKETNKQTNKQIKKERNK